MGYERNRKRIVNSERGAALVIALFIIAVLTVLGVLVLNTSIVEVKMATNQQVSSRVFYAAEAGLERALKVLIEDFENDSSAGSPWGNSTYAVAGTVTETAVTGAETFTVGSRTMDMYLNSPSVVKLNFTGGTTLGPVSYEVYIYKVNPTEVYVMSYGTGLGGVASVEYYLEVDDLSPYNNAIFTGAGVSGHFQGSVNVAGSVYSHGNLDIGANVAFTNNYATGHHPLTAGDTVYDLINQVTDLESKIRVKGGNLTLASGSAEFGYTGADNSLAGIYVDGTSNIDSVGTHYYDEFSNEVPDVPMPTILDGLTGEFGNGITATCGYTGSDAAVAMSIYADWANGTGCDPTGTGTSTGAVFNGSITLDQTDTDGWIVGPDINNNGIYYDAPPGGNGMGRITVQGNVVITGDLSFGDNQLDGLYYDAVGPDTGSGTDAADGATLVVGGDIDMKGSFYPDNGYLKGVTYPGTNDINSLGIVSAGDISFSGHNNDTIAGFMYAEGQVNFNKQVKYAGTVIAGLVNYAQVPDVYQVPNLKNYLPPGMPGGFNLLVFTTRQWRRVY